MKLKRKLTTGQLQDYFDGFRELDEEYDGKDDAFYGAAKMIIPAIESGWYEDVDPQEVDAAEMVREIDPLDLWGYVESIDGLYAKYKPPAKDPN
jgi:hypothetical protein